MFTRTVQSGGGSVTMYERFTNLDTEYNQVNATDANPITVATGDFSNVKSLIALGKYGYSGFDNENSGTEKAITLNTWVHFEPVSEHNNGPWRNIKVTPTSIQIGTGGYNSSTVDSLYGIVKNIIVFFE